MVNRDPHGTSACVPQARALAAAHPLRRASKVSHALLRIMQRVITLVPRKHAGPKRGAADTGAVTLIQRFGSAAN